MIDIDLYLLQRYKLAFFTIGTVSRRAVGASKAHSFVYILRLFFRRDHAPKHRKRAWARLIQKIYFIVLGHFPLFVSGAQNSWLSLQIIAILSKRKKGNFYELKKLNSEREVKARQWKKAIL